MIRLHQRPKRGDNVDNPKEFTHISLCAGYGGIDLGLKRALGNVRTIAFSEIEAFACANLVAKMEAGFLEPAPIWTNLKTFPWGRFRGKVDLLSGGFPCQPFSSAGNRAGTEDPRHLFPFILEGIRLCRPAIIFLENVEGIISSKLKGDEWSDPEGTPVLLHVLRELERVDYQATAGVFSAAEVGAPHQRKRVFILAVDLTSRTSERITRALVHQRGDTLEGRGESIQEGGKRELCVSDSHLAFTSTAYPAGRGQDQHKWEPPRTVGDSKSGNGEGSGGPEELSRGWNTRVQNRESSELGDSNCERREQNLEQSTKQGTTGVVQRPGASLDNADREGCIRDLVDEARTDTKGRAIANGHDASTSASSGQIQGQIEPALGRDFDGAAHRLDTTLLYESVDNRTDELRLLGNGVVPDTAARAFCLLWQDLANASGLAKGRGFNGISQKVYQENEGERRTIRADLASSDGIAGGVY